MTIGKRLIVLVAVPLVALLVLGIFARIRLSEIEYRSRFVAETQLGSVAALGSISASFAELRVSVRNMSARCATRASGPRRAPPSTRTSESLPRYSSNTPIPSSATSATASFSASVEELNRQYIVEARQVMALAEEGRHDEAADTLREHSWTDGCHASPTCPASGSSTTWIWEPARPEPPSRQSRKRGRKSWLPTWRRSC